jgi:hypothetical protein
MEKCAVKLVVFNGEDFGYCNIPATPGLAIVTSDNYLGS